jgi:hypothetical protein
MKVYMLGYGDCECYNLIAIFSTKEKAEEYLAPYKELEKIYGENFMFGFYPSIKEIEIDAVKEESLRFITAVHKVGDKFHLYTKLYESYMGKESSNKVYKTFTIDRDKVLEEAKKYFASLPDDMKNGEELEDEDFDFEFEDLRGKIND